MRTREMTRIVVMMMLLDAWDVVLALVNLSAWRSCLVHA